jgi:hypothetical protein
MGLDDSWSGIEGTKDGKLFLARFRDLPADRWPDLRFPRLFVISWSYDCDDETGLPRRDFYEQISAFEAAGIDTIERQAMGVLVCTETSQGRMDEFLYVKEVGEVVESLNEILDHDAPVEFFESMDPEWDEYRKFGERIRGGASGA